MSTRNKAIAIVLFVIFAMSLVFVSISLYDYHKGNQDRIATHKNSLAHIVESEFDQLSRSYTFRLDGFVKTNKNIIQAFTERDRVRLLTLSKQRYSVLLKENPDFSDIIFYLPDGTLMLSMRNPKSIGTDYSQYDYIKHTINNLVPVYGFTINNSRLQFHVASPVIVDNQLKGIVEFKINTSKMTETIKAVLGADYGIAVVSHINTANMGDISGTVMVDSNNTVFDELPAGFSYSAAHQSVTIDGKTYIIYSRSIKDYKGAEIGFFLTMNDISEFRNRYISFVMYIILVTGIALIISSAILFFGFGTILKKIEMLNINLESKVEERTKELKAAKEKALEQNKIINSLYRRFKSMFQDHHSIMFLIDPENGTVMDANTAAKELLVPHTKSVEGMKIKEISLLPDSEINNILTKGAKEGMKDYLTTFRIGGQMVDMEVQATPIEIEGKNIIFTICYNVTEKIRMEKELKELNKDLEKRINQEMEKRHQQELLLIQQSKMSSVGELLSAIIHQWKQPITAISYLMQDIADAAERGQMDNYYVQNMSAEALTQLNYMTQTVEDFRSFLMPSKAKNNFDVAHNVLQTIKILCKQIEKDSIDLHLTVINSTAETYAYTLKDICETDKIDVDTKCFSCFGYPNEFKQVVLNVINNARDAIKNKAVASEDYYGSINIVTSCSSEQIEIGISDNAGGISSDIIDRVFEPYFTTKSSKGTGIGLYMAKSIIENHMDGTISVRNSEQGALFTIVLKKTTSS